jgi:hypothetical protein
MKIFGYIILIIIVVVTVICWIIFGKYNPNPTFPDPCKPPTTVDFEILCY